MAALFSIPFTPVFGAIMHALNWRRLGQHNRAKVAWLWAAFIFVAFLSVTIFGAFARLSDETFEGYVRLTQMSTLILWYFGAARAQGKYIVHELRKEYHRESWFVPVCAAIILIGSILGLAGSIR